MEPHRAELELAILPAAATTTFSTSGAGDQRAQRVLAWAGPIAEDLPIDTAILHLAPVARETPRRWRGDAGFVGLTPQGLYGTGASTTGRSSSPRPSSALIPESLRAMVLSEHERENCEELIADATRARAVVAITAGARPTTVRLAGADSPGRGPPGRASARRHRRGGCVRGGLLRSAGRGS